MNLKKIKKTKLNLPLPALLFLVLFFVVLSWIPYLRILSHDLSFGDEGLIAQGAFRIFNGDIPFKDFFSGLTPGAFYFYALLFKLFSPTFIVMRFGVIAVSGLLIFSVWSVLKKLSVTSPLPYIASGLFLAYFGGPVWFVASHHWLSTLLCIASLYFLLPHINHHVPSTLHAIISGVIAASAAFTLQHRGALWIIAATISITFLPKTNRLKIFIAFWSGILLFSIPWIFYFLSTVGWDALYYQLISFPLNQYPKLEKHSGIDIHPIEMFQRYIASFQYISRPGALLKIAVWSFGLIGMNFIYLAPLIATAALYYLAIYSKQTPRFSYALLGGALISSYLATLHRLSDTTLFFASSSAIILISVALSTALHSKETKTYNFARVSLIVLCLLFGGISAGYSHLMFYRKSSSHTTPSGVVKTVFKEEGVTLKNMTEFISNHIKTGESLLCYPYNPIHYFLFRFNNASKYDVLTYPMYTRQQLEDVEKTLEIQKIDWVIVDAYQKPDLSMAIPLERYLLKHYTPKASSPYTIIMERNK